MPQSGQIHHDDSASQLPLSALLSYLLVAYTIEFDNEFEHQMPHKTTNHGITKDTAYAPWLISLVMWLNCMQFVREEGVTLNELYRLARTRTNLDGMRRWGYITLESLPSHSGSKQPRGDSIIRPTLAGREAQELCRPLVGVIETRWQERLGGDIIHHLRSSLDAVIRQSDVELPDCLPILGHGLFSKDVEYERRIPTTYEESIDSSLSLPTLLSRALLTFAIEFERESELSLAMSANVLRVLNEQGTYIHDLPGLTGISKEAIAMSLNYLEKYGYIVIQSKSSGSRTKIATPTLKGNQAQELYYQLVQTIEEQWRFRFGKDVIHFLRSVLEQIVGTSQVQMSPLFEGLKPYPDGWRASVRMPDTLPHYPMVLHRGGFPDGS